MMRQAPLGHDTAAAAHNPCGPPRCDRNEPQQHAGMDRKIIHTLLGLFDQRIPENFPCKVLGTTIHFFESLINGHGANGHGAVSNDPFAGGVDVFSRGKIHHCIRAPSRGPTHLFDLLLNAGGHRTVADVRIDFHQKITTNNHWLQFRVIDIGGNDCPP